MVVALFPSANISVLFPVLIFSFSFWYHFIYVIPDYWYLYKALHKPWEIPRVKRAHIPVVVTTSIPEWLNQENRAHDRHRKPTEEFYELTLFKVSHHKINNYFSSDLAVEAEDLLGDRQINACSRAGTLEKWQKEFSWRNRSSGNGNNSPQRRFVNRILKDT